MILFSLSIIQRTTLVYALMGATVAAGAESPLGVWINPKETVAVRIFQCEERLCGRIIWLKKLFDKSGEPKRDHHNPNKAQRHRPLCGLKILRDFKSVGDNRWEDGTIYNPSDGAIYHSMMRLTSEETLELRGYIGLPLFGKSITWRRADISETACDSEGAKRSGSEQHQSP